MAHRRRLARIFLVLLVAVPLCVSPTWGTPRCLSIELNPFAVIAGLWEAVAAVWSESGLVIDPNGGSAPAQAEPPTTTPTTDSGCGADPFGGCTPGS